MNKFTAPGMWDYLTNMSKFNETLPIYVEKPFSEDQVDRVKAIIENLLNAKPEHYLVPGGQEEYRGKNWYDPKKVSHMSREMVEFLAPVDLELTMDKYAKHLHQDEIKLCHYSYIDYNPVHGDGKYAPSLPPHIDNTETLVTFNYMLDGNIDWEIYIDGKSYDLKVGDAIMFSAVNQPHFRPKRNWKEGEFVKILTFDYSPLTDWRFLNQDFPLDPLKFQGRIAAYHKALSNEPKMQSAWSLYNQLGTALGYDTNTHGSLDSV